MRELSFECLDVRPEDYAAAPTLTFRLRIDETARDPIHAMVLRCQIRLEPRKRRYDDEEAGLLGALFGDRSRWGETLKPIQFANTSVTVSGFTGTTEIDVPLTCGYDLDVTAGQYFHALRDGEIPFLLLFSGTIFGKGDNGFWVEQVPWDLEASYRMPVAVWQEMMDRHFPQQGWIRLHRDTIDALLRYKAENAVPTWDAAMEQLLGTREAVS